MASFRGLARGLIERGKEEFGATACEFDHTVFNPHWHLLRPWMCLSSSRMLCYVDGGSLECWLLYLLRSDKGCATFNQIHKVRWSLKGTAVSDAVRAALLGFLVLRCNDVRAALWLIKVPSNETTVGMIRNGTTPLKYRRTLRILLSIVISGNSIILVSLYRG